MPCDAAVTSDAEAARVREGVHNGTDRQTFDTRSSNAMTPAQTVSPVEAPPPTCPLCHTPGPLSFDALQAGGYWACARCGQTWTGERLETFAAYARSSDSFNRSVPVGLQAAETIH